MTQTPDGPDAENPDTSGALASTPLPREPRDGVPDVIADEATLAAYADRLAHGTGPLALDAERASGYRYSQRAYLVQLRREGAGTALIDPVAVPDLSPIQRATEGVEWILHAATQDLACLAEVGLHPSALFDTELAGRLLGREKVGLAPLVLSELGEVLEKGHGAADWSLRPLSQGQLRYAALDVELLVELREVMHRELVAADKWEYAQQEFESLLTFTPRDRGPDEWRRTSGIHRIRKPRQLAVVRELWLTRDELARERDVGVGRLLPDSAIVAAASANPAPTSSAELAETQGFNGRGAGRYLRQWWAAVQRAQRLPDADLPLSSTPPTGPPQPRAWAERDPVAWARLSAARRDVGAIAERLGMPVENLLSPDLVRRLCWEPPVPGDESAVTAFLRDGGARRWQIELTAPTLADDLKAQPAPEADPA